MRCALEGLSCVQMDWSSGAWELRSELEVEYITLALDSLRNITEIAPWHEFEECTCFQSSTRVEALHMAI